MSTLLQFRCLSIILRLKDVEYDEEYECLIRTGDTYQFQNDS